MILARKMGVWGYYRGAFLLNSSLLVKRSRR